MIWRTIWRMTWRHPATSLVPYLRGDLDPAERGRLECHLAECARCRAELASTERLIGALARVAAAPAAPDWALYRAELWQKLAARAETPARGGHRVLADRPLAHRLWRPAWLSLATVSAAALALFLTLQLRNGTPTPPPVDQLALEDAMAGANLELLRAYPVVEHLDLLENYDVIEHFDELASSPAASSVGTDDQLRS